MHGFLGYKPGGALSVHRLSQANFQTKKGSATPDKPCTEKSRPCETQYNCLGSNGKAQGQIKRLKALRRAMYERAGPELLRACMLFPPYILRRNPSKGNATTGTASLQPDFFSNLLNHRIWNSALKKSAAPLFSVQRAVLDDDVTARDHRFVPTRHLASCVTDISKSRQQPSFSNGVSKRVACLKISSPTPKQYKLLTSQRLAGRIVAMLLLIALWAVLLRPSL